MKEKMNNSSPELSAFKRAPALGLSQWENGNLTCSRLQDSKGFSERHRFPRRTTRLLRRSHLALPFRTSSNLPPDYGIQFG